MPHVPQHEKEIADEAKYGYQRGTGTFKPPICLIITAKLFRSPRKSHIGRAEKVNALDEAHLTIVPGPRRHHARGLRRARGFHGFSLQNLPSGKSF